MDISSFDARKPEATRKTQDGKSQYEDEQLKEACRSFESIFLTQVLSSMRKTGFHSDLFGDDKEGDLFKGMLDEERAKIWSEQGGIGLANLLYEQLKGKGMSEKFRKDL